MRARWVNGVVDVVILCSYQTIMLCANILPSSSLTYKTKKVYGEGTSCDRKRKCDAITYCCVIGWFAAGRYYPSICSLFGASSSYPTHDSAINTSIYRSWELAYAHTRTLDSP